MNVHFDTRKKNAIFEPIKLTLLMVYKFLLLSDEADNFSREIEIGSDATFLQFHETILASVGYSKDQITSFFICGENWEKHEEITLIEMDSSSEYDNFVMEDTHLDEFVEDEGQRLLYVFDNLTERSFFIELKAVMPGKNLSAGICTLSKGKAPVQIVDIDDFATNQKVNFDTDFYGDEEFDLEELDENSFGDVTFDENGREI